jgi:hypothetical protein
VRKTIYGRAAIGTKFHPICIQLIAADIMKAHQIHSAKSNDLYLEPLEVHGLTINAIIHHTDTVSGIVACSLNSAAVDLKGLVL